jgi:hypothetical protein
VPTLLDCGACGHRAPASTGPAADEAAVDLPGLDRLPSVPATPLRDYAAEAGHPEWHPTPATRPRHPTSATCPNRSLAPPSQSSFARMPSWALKPAIVS